MTARMAEIRAFMSRTLVDLVVLEKAMLKSVWGLSFIYRPTEACGYRILLRQLPLLMLMAQNKTSSSSKKRLEVSKVHARHRGD